MGANEDKERQALDTFIATEWAGLLVAVRLTCGSAVDAEGALAVARALEQRRRARPIRNLRGWVLTVAVNEIRSQARRAAVATRHQQRIEPLLQHQVDSDGSSVDLLRALVHLTPRQREAIILHYWADLSTAQVGRAMGITAGTVKALLYQGRSALEPLVRTAHDQSKETAP